MAETSPSEQRPEPEPELPVQPEEISPEERVWLEGEDPTLMLHGLNSNLASRKARLFLVGCLYSIANQCPNNSIELAEKYADGLATRKELSSMMGSLTRRERSYNNRHSDDITISTVRRVFMENINTENDDIAETSSRISRIFTRKNVSSSEIREKGEEVFNQERAKQADLLRDVIRNPFAKEPVELDPRWLSSTVLDLAKTIYEEKNFEIMPILADALMDAGCDSEEIISHCQKSDCQHVRGCWVLDLILKKE